MSTHGVHAGCLADMWQVAIEIAQRAGGDRGCLGLFGPPTLPLASKPERLIVLETEGWASLDEATSGAFTQLLESLQSTGITVLRRASHPWIEAMEHAIAQAGAVCNAITGWENRWAQRNLLDEHPDGLSQRAKNALARAEAMSPEDYRAALLQREAAQLCHTRLAPLADAIITLSCPGPAPLWPGDVPGQPLAPRPTGDAVFNYPSSMLFAPAVTVPLLSVGGMPVGVQLMGQQHSDARITALARWLLETVSPVLVR